MAVILVVEDEVFTRELAGMCMEDWGHAVLFAGSVAEAIKHLKSGAAIDALFTDDTRVSGVTTTVAGPATGPTVTAPVTTLAAQPAPSPATTVPAPAGVTTTTRPL